MFSGLFCGINLSFFREKRFMIPLSEYMVKDAAPEGFSRPVVQ